MRWIFWSERDGSPRSVSYLCPRINPVMDAHISGPGPGVRPVSRACFDGNDPIFPVGMGYVPVQMWGTTYPLARGFVRGTIFPTLDLPFAMGRCRR